MKKKEVIIPEYFGNLKKCVLSIFAIAPFAGLLNYYLITESLKAGLFDYPASAIVLTVLFPFACLFTGMVISVNILSRKK